MILEKTRAAFFGNALVFLVLPFVAMAFDLNEMKGEMLFSSNRSGSWCIWMMQANGSDIRQITKTEADAMDADPRFSPDGKWILFSSTRGGKTGIWKMHRDGSQPERICDGDQAEWSPDGARIAFRRDEKIWIRDLAQSAEKTISPADWPHCSGPSWSPDGTRIAFACRWDAGNGLFLVDTQGGEPVKIYDKYGACEPHWSPDGKRLVYETETHLYTIQPDGTGNRPLTYYGGVQRYGQWSPNGDYIVYCQGVTENGPWELYVVPAKGGTPVQLTSGRSDLNPDWK